MWPAEQHHHILGASPIQLRPTQITVGYAEVREKRREWATGATSSSARLPTLAGAMTTYAWAQLKPGSYGLPGPAVVMNR